MTRLDAIARICESAVAVEKSGGCPAEMLVAQCYVESNCLQSAPANNALGFKSYPNEYGRQLLKTREWFTDDQAAEFAANLDGRSIVTLGPALGAKKLYAITDWFATFPSLEACFARRAERWQAGQNLPWVLAFHQTQDLPTMLRAMATGYSTAPGYADALLSVLAMPEVQDGLAKARSDFGTRTA
jgi:flagellum-specific peptidoglycan hydrolase FlgJ